MQVRIVTDKSEVNIKSVPPLNRNPSTMRHVFHSVGGMLCPARHNLLCWQPKSPKGLLESEAHSFRVIFLKSCISENDLNICPFISSRICCFEEFGSETCLYHFADNIERFALKSSCLSLAKLHRFIFL